MDFQMLSLLPCRFADCLYQRRSRTYQRVEVGLKSFASKLTSLFFLKIFLPYDFCSPVGVTHSCAYRPKRHQNAVHLLQSSVVNLYHSTCSSTKESCRNGIPIIKPHCSVSFSCTRAGLLCVCQHYPSYSRWRSACLIIFLIF